MLVSLPVCIYITFDEGFMRGKAYMMLVAFVIACWGYGFKDIYMYFRKKIS
jgi:hypothetical protein